MPGHLITSKENTVKSAIYLSALDMTHVKRPYILSNINLAGAHKVNSIHDIVRPHFGLRIFAPPFGPPDLMVGTSSLHDDPLIGGTEWLGETGQCGLDEP